MLGCSALPSNPAAMEVSPNCWGHLRLKCMRSLSFCSELADVVSKVSAIVKCLVLCVQRSSFCFFLPRVILRLRRERANSIERLQQLAVVPVIHRRCRHAAGVVPRYSTGVCIIIPNTRAMRPSTSKYGKVRQSTSKYGKVRQSTAKYGDLRQYGNVPRFCIDLKRKRPPLGGLKVCRVCGFYCSTTASTYILHMENRGCHNRWIRFKKTSRRP